jgi:hypothetical protein
MKRTTPAVEMGITDHVWSIGELIDAALTAAPPKPTPTAPDRRRQFRVIQGGVKVDACNYNFARLKRRSFRI